jgi:hypothetical protein
VKARLINLIAAVRTLLRSESCGSNGKGRSEDEELIPEGMAWYSPTDRTEYRRVSAASQKDFREELRVISVYAFQYRLRDRPGIA